jgi:hypothetical protein
LKLWLRPARFTAFLSKICSANLTIRRPGRQKPCDGQPYVCKIIDRVTPTAVRLRDLADVLALALGLLGRGNWGTAATYSFFLGAVMLSSWINGLGPGILSTVLGTVPYLEQHSISYPVVVGDADFAKLFRIDSLPVTFLIDRNGRIADWHIGMVVKSTWEDEIRTLLREKAKK